MRKQSLSGKHVCSPQMWIQVMVKFAHQKVNFHTTSEHHRRMVSKQVIVSMGGFIPLSGAEQL